MENNETLSALKKIADVLDARLEEISNKLDDVTASLQNLLIEEELDDDDEEN